MSTVAVPDSWADAAVTVAAFAIAAAALSTPDVTLDETTMRTVAPAATIAAGPTAVTRTRRRRGRRRSPSGPLLAATVAIRERTSTMAASTAAAKPVVVRGLALRRASKLSDMLMILLRVHVRRDVWAKPRPVGRAARTPRLRGVAHTPCESAGARGAGGLAR